MTSWMNNLFPPVKATPPVEWGGGTQGVQGGDNFFVTGKTTEIGISSFPTESMTYLNTASTGSVYKNGLGHSGFGAITPYWA